MNILKYFCLIMVLTTAVACQAAVEPTVTATAVPPTATATAVPTATPLPLPPRPEPDPTDTPTPEAELETVAEELEEVEPEGDTAENQVIPGEPFQLRLGETAVFAETTITFRDVSEDSRCPKSVDCFWEGQGIVELDITTPDGQTTREQLNTNSPDNTRAYQQYQIQLLELAPYPQTTDPIPQEMYEATLVINGASD